MVQRPTELGAFEFAVLSGLRAAQLARGCTPRVNGSSKVTVVAQLEVADRKVGRAEGRDEHLLKPSDDEGAFSGDGRRPAIADAHGETESPGARSPL